MARKSKTGVLKRLREVKKAEKAALKQMQKEERKATVEPKTSQVATKDDLAGYGLANEEEDAGGSEPPPA